MMIDAGNYRAKAKSWDLGTAGSGTPQVGIEFELLDHAGQSITYYGFLTDKALPHAVKAMRSCGWQGADLADLSGMDANEVVLVVEHETYEGKTSAKVKWVNSAGGLAMSNSLQGAELSSFAAEMKGKILALDPASAKQRAASPVRSVSQPAPQPSGPPEPPPISDEDGMPF
jgi:hypothetical protein